MYSLLEVIILLFFILITVGIGFQYFFGTTLTATLNDLFSEPTVVVDIVQDVGEQTFHVMGKFDSAAATSVCKAYGAKVATLDQVTTAHKKGGEWCDYGWSTDNMALYPTQQSSWKKYQDTANPSKCGIPGINGGYNLNPKQKLGANCFGQKPDGTMPETIVEPESIDRRGEYWKSQTGISPFNYKSWSQF